MCLIEALTLLNLNRVLPRTLGFVLTLGLFFLASRHFLDRFELPAGVTPAMLFIGAAHVGIMIFLTFMPTARLEIVPIRWAHASLYTLLPFTAPLFIFTDLLDYPLYMTSTFVLIWSQDTFAYLTGRWLGKTKMAPSISPKKTVEGLIGGAIFTVIIALFIIPLFTEDLSRPALLGMSVITIFGGTLGDLYESKLKRRIGVKDSGNLIPGHGGILDRLDSYLFIMPLSAIYLYLLII
jgi:phosphatidate cytidylyltransferase